MTESTDELRDRLNASLDLARLLFEQQFTQCGGRKPADPTWDDLEQSERDDWLTQARNVGPLLAEKEAELDGLRDRAEKRLAAREDWKARYLATESSRRHWAAEAMRLEEELKRERKIGAAYAEQARTHRCIPIAGGPESPAVSLNVPPVCAVHEEGQ